MLKKKKKRIGIIDQFLVSICYDTDLLNSIERFHMDRPVGYHGNYYWTLYLYAKAAQVWSFCFKSQNYKTKKKAQEDIDVLLEYLRDLFEYRLSENTKL